MKRGPSNGRYILDGKKPVECEDLLEWAMWMENGPHAVAKNRIAYKDVIVIISTVFLGLDHQFGFGKPLLFETKVFGGPLDGRTRRYHTWDEAERGHQEVFAEVDAKIIEEIKPGNGHRRRA